ncbi:tetratricopeptide repeat protein [Shewanella salipaludis]|uniref:Sel1 repeat family protein n=1 Tax=Shewanella salipaludis TaxID=2723052 RepID=A0A972JKN7_9GAMM|nr:sel1 repeat family protein [Shewanella salipaludis]
MKYRQWIMGLGLGLSLGLSSAANAFSIPQPVRERAASKLAHIQLQATQGEAEAQFLLGLMYLSGRFVVQDSDLGMQWVTEAAKQQHVKAQQTLADIAFEGKLVPRDLAAAEHWYRQLGQQGHKWAQFRLGFIYASGGDGVRRNCGKAVEHFSAAGDDIALGNVAWILATCPEAEYRNGDRAVALALELLRHDQEDPTHLDNLAAAYAESGDFNAAIATQEKAIQALKQQSTAADTQEFESRLSMYQQRRAFREVFPLTD